MPLSDFFRINLPYGIKRNSKNEWFAFNREYVPIGWNKKDHEKSFLQIMFFQKIPFIQNIKV